MKALLRLILIGYLTSSHLVYAESRTNETRSMDADTKMHSGFPTDSTLEKKTMLRAEQCKTGIFKKSDSRFLAITKSSRGYDYTFNDGVVGNTLDPNSLITCTDAAILVRKKEAWTKAAIIETNTHFESNDIVLAGRLIEPINAGKHTTLVVYAHGSEEGPWIDHARDPYQMVGRGVSVFFMTNVVQVYRKENTRRTFLS